MLKVTKQIGIIDWFLFIIRQIRLSTLTIKIAFLINSKINTMKSKTQILFQSTTKDLNSKLQFLKKYIF